MMTARACPSRRSSTGPMTAGHSQPVSSSSAAGHAARPLARRAYAEKYWPSFSYRLSVVSSGSHTASTFSLFTTSASPPGRLAIR